MVMASTSGMMAPCMKASGSRIKLMAVAYMSGQMAENTTVNGKTITCTAREFTPGKMASSTKAGGKMANNTVKEYIEKTVAIVEESGRTVRESNGLMISSGRTCRMLDKPKNTSIKAMFKTKREDTIN
jgi:hypothetical protein